MKDTVNITSIGCSIGFTISPDLLSKLGIDLGDLVEFEIYEIIKGRDPRPISVFMSRKIITIGGGSKGVTIKTNVAKQFEIQAGDMVGVDVKMDSK